MDFGCSWHALGLEKPSKTIGELFKIKVWRNLVRGGLRDVLGSIFFDFWTSFANLGGPWEVFGTSGLNVVFKRILKWLGRAHNLKGSTWVGAMGRFLGPTNRRKLQPADWKLQTTACTLETIDYRLQNKEKITYNTSKPGLRSLVALWGRRMFFCQLDWPSEAGISIFS